MSKMDKSLSPIFLENNHESGNIRLGLMGGTFDPIHMGHLVTAEDARQQFRLDYVIYVPAGYPPHKETGDITLPEHRFIMTSLAVMSNPSFYVSRVELDREGPTYTIDTVRYFLSGKKGKIELFFITGADAILEIFSWKNYEELLNICTFIAVSRPGYSLESFHEKMKKKCPLLQYRVHLLEIPSLSVSSTFIRERVALGKTIKYLTPEPVEQYIKKLGLYKT